LLLGKAKKDTGNDPACVGGDLEISSNCCANDHFTACDDNDATELCTTNVQGQAYRLNDGALDSSEVECDQCRAGQECRYCAEDGEYQCQLGTVARNAVIGIFAGLAALLLLLLIICCCCCKKGKERFEPTYLEPKPKPEPVPVPPIVPPSSSSTSPEPTPEPSREPTPIPEPVLVQNAPSSSSESSSESEAEIAEPEILVEAAQDSPPPTPSPTPSPTPPPTPPPLDDPLLRIPDAHTGESSVTDHVVSGDEAATESGVGLGEMRPAIEAELVDLSRHNVTEFKWSEAQTTDTETVQKKTVYDSPPSE